MQNARLAFNTEHEATRRYWNVLTLVYDHVERAHHAIIDQWRQFDKETQTTVINNLTQVLNQVNEQFHRLLIEFGIIRTTNEDINTVVNCLKKLENLPQYNHVNNLLAMFYNEAGFLWQDKNELELAIKMYTKAIEKCPEYALCYTNRGCFYYTDNYLLGAINDYRIALKYNPQDIDTYYNMALIYDSRELKDKEAMFHYFGKCIHLKEYSHETVIDALEQRQHSYCDETLYVLALYDAILLNQIYDDTPNESHGERNDTNFKYMKVLIQEGSADRLFETNGQW
jgi:tetratricopeptide (TPR) repeat protein